MGSQRTIGSKQQLIEELEATTHIVRIDVIEGIERAKYSALLSGGRYKRSEADYSLGKEYEVTAYIVIRQKGRA